MLLGYLGAALVGLAIAALVASLGERRTQGVDRLARAGVLAPGQTAPVPPPPGASVGPGVATRLAGRLQRVVPGRRRMDSDEVSRLRQRLDRAGLTLPAEGLWALKMSGLGVGLLLGLAAGMLIAALTELGSTVGVLTIVVGAAIGFLTPDLWVMHRAQSRQQEIQLAMPETLDLLALTAQAGLGLEQGIGEVSNELRGPLAVELDRFLREQQLGRSRREALQNLATRNTAEDLRSFTQALLQADELGTPVSQTLQVQAREMRRRRRARARERANKAPV